MPAVPGVVDVNASSLPSGDHDTVLQNPTSFVKSFMPVPSAFTTPMHWPLSSWPVLNARRLLSGDHTGNDWKFGPPATIERRPVARSITMTSTSLLLEAWKASFVPSGEMLGPATLVFPNFRS